MNHSKVRARAPKVTGRAALGGTLVTIAALGTFVVASGSSTATPPRFVVARRAIAIGAVLHPDDVELRPIDLDPAQAVHALADAAAITGKVATGPIAVGELVQRGSVTDAPPDAGVDEVTISLAADRALAGRLAVNDVVDVLATYDRCTVAVVRGARVDATTSGTGGLGEQSTLVTLGLPANGRVLAVVNAVRAGQVTLSRPAPGTPAPLVETPAACAEVAP